MNFHDLFKLMSATTWYKKILWEEYQRNNSSQGTYYKDPNTKIHLVDTDDHISDEEITNIDVAKGGDYMAICVQSSCKSIMNPKDSLIWEWCLEE